jgi:predicted ATPase
VSACLQALVRKQILAPDETTASGEDAFRFAHMLMRDAAYRALPKGQRAELHERHAQTLERRSGSRASEYEEILGYHLEQAYIAWSELGPVDERAVEAARRGGSVLFSAGRRALTRGDWPAATNLLTRSRFLVEAGGENPTSVLLALGSALRESERLRERDAALALAIEKAQRSGQRSGGPD